ncbi:hypothetical protein AB0D62_30950 [Streptomyces massasporeus]
MSALAARPRDPDLDPGVRLLGTRRTTPADTGAAALTGSAR